MEDIEVCPICSCYLKNALWDFCREKTCQGLNHYFQIMINKESNKLDSMRFSINPWYSVYIFIDFINIKSVISIFDSSLGKTKEIEVPFLFEPDFPDLIKLKEKINTYLAFL